MIKTANPDLRARMNAILKGFIAATRPPEPLAPWQWAEKYVTVDNTSPMPGRWRSDNAPWVRELMEVFADNRVRLIVVMCSAQSSKTQTLLILLCWLIVEDPGPVLWLGAAKDELKDFVRDRVSPTLRDCKPVRDLMLGESVMGFEFSTTPVYFAGAGSKSKVKSKPIRYLLADEVEEYPPGHLQNAMTRTTAFDSWNSRKVLISTPHMKGGTMDVEFLKGDQRVFHACCPKCGTLQTLKWDNLKWDTNETTKPDGKWNFEELAKTIRLECSNAECDHEWRDIPNERKALARGGQFVRLNPTAPPWCVSFHWNAMLPPWVSWASLVEEFLHARSAARGGDIEALKSFVNNKLGEAWEDQLGVIEDWGFLEARKQDYDFDEVWPEEIDRGMAADRQEAGGEHYWWLVQSVGQFGKTRIVAYGRCASTHELEGLRVLYNVPLSNAMLDSGWKATEVYRFCLATGWKAFKGDDYEYFLFKDKITGRVVRRVWERTFVDPYLGTRKQGRAKPLKLYRFADNAVKDLVAEEMTGLVGEWTIPKKIGREFMKQVTAERRIESVDSKNQITRKWVRKVRDNHIFDCLKMLKVWRVIKGYSSQKPVSKGNDSPSMSGENRGQAGQAAAVLPGGAGIGQEPQGSS